jgi:hypothetical protein
LIVDLALSDTLNRARVETYAFGLSKRFLLADGTMVPVDEADEAEDEESFGEVGRRRARSS